MLMMIAATSKGQNRVQQKLPPKTRILFVLDGSGSMEAKWTGGVSRMQIAKNILTRLVDSLRANPDVELALRVYGHRFSYAANNCEDSKLEVGFAAGNHQSIINKIMEIRPKGTTPISFSLQQAANDFPSDAGYRNILILITDGIESCGGDPCAVSLALQRRGVFLKPFIIGLGVEGAKTLECIGTYLNSENPGSFHHLLNESIETTFAKTTVSIELLNGSGRPTETNVDVSFINNATGIASYEFVHYLDRNGKPDSVQIDPVLSYDLIVNTVPPLIRKNINIQNGKHNVLTIPAPQGNLIIKAEARGQSFYSIVREKGKTRILLEQQVNAPYRYLAGEYEVETMTLPRRIFTVTIQADKTETISVPGTGLVNVNTISPGIGSLFEILDNGETVWVCHLNENISRHSYNLLPGRYKIAFRVKYAGGSKYTAIKNFEIHTGQTLNLNMFN